MNLRYRLTPYDGLANRCLKPLGHPSRRLTNLLKFYQITGKKYIRGSCLGRKNEPAYRWFFILAKFRENLPYLSRRQSCNKIILNLDRS